MDVEGLQLIRFVPHNDLIMAQVITGDGLWFDLLWYVNHRIGVTVEPEFAVFYFTPISPRGFLLYRSEVECRWVPPPAATPARIADTKVKPFEIVRPSPSELEDWKSLKRGPRKVLDLAELKEQLLRDLGQRFPGVRFDSEGGYRAG